jgi:hypothetical protein
LKDIKIIAKCNYFLHFFSFKTPIKNYNSKKLTETKNPISIESEIAEMKNDIKDLKNTIKEMVEMMKAVYDFEETYNWRF